MWSPEAGGAFVVVVVVVVVVDDDAKMFVHAWRPTTPKSRRNPEDMEIPKPAEEDNKIESVELDHLQAQEAEQASPSEVA